MPKTPTWAAQLRRSADYTYVAFFVIHLLASVLIDAQYFIPTEKVPNSLIAVKLNYLRDSGDPLVLGLGDPSLAWFEAALVLELAFQVPCFVVGIIGLLKNRPQIYPLLIAYGAVASSSTLLCLAQVFRGPSASSLSATNIQNLAQAYIPFTVLPLILTIDMVVRCTQGMRKATRRSKKSSKDRKGRRDDKHKRAKKVRSSVDGDSPKKSQTRSRK